MKQAGSIILASNSPRRKAFFSLLGLHVEVMPSGIEEVLLGMDPDSVIREMTRQKVAVVRSKLRNDWRGWLVGADTIVSLDSEMIGKPKDQEEAKLILLKLSGKQHQVMTGFRVERHDGVFRESLVTTLVTMAAMTTAQIDWYVDSGEVMDKAGAYAIQGKGGLFVKSISGSYSNVVGLPLFEVVQALVELGAICIEGHSR